MAAWSSGEVQALCEPEIAEHLLGGAKLMTSKEAAHAMLCVVYRSAAMLWYCGATVRASP